MHRYRHFVPNITFGAPLVKCLRAKVPNAFFGKRLKLLLLVLILKFVDMHMMVSEPEKVTRHD